MPVNPWGQLGQKMGTEIGGLLTQDRYAYLKSSAYNEGGADSKAEKEAQKLVQFRNNPQMLNLMISGNEYWQKNKRGEEYLRFLLAGGFEKFVKQTGLQEYQTATTPETLSPAERGQWQQQRTGALLSTLPGARGAGQQFTPELQQQYQKGLTPFFQQQGYPEQVLRPKGAGAAWYEQEKQAYGGKPISASEAARRRVAGEEILPVPETYKEWAANRDEQFTQLGGTEQALVAALTMGGHSLRNFPVNDVEIFRQYPALQRDEALRTKLGMTGSLLDFDQTMIEVAPLDEKLNAYLHLISTVRLGDRAQRYIFFNWFFGPEEAPEPVWAGRQWQPR